MSIIPPISPTSSGTREVIYPTGDGRPLAETPVHRDNLVITIKILERKFAEDPMVYVSGNMLMFYEQGNKHRHVAPDVFMTRGVPKEKPRKSYFVWEEGRGPDLVIELTSKSTRKEDLETKLRLYRDTLHVSEYFLFDPYAEYLRPPLKGFRLDGTEYVPVELDAGRLKSDVARVEFEAHGMDLWVFDADTGGRLLRDTEARDVAEEQLAESRAELVRAEAEREQLAGALETSQSEIERLRRELDALRRRQP
ncbi:MAG TPA: Uma2 family endonuclease [Pirellulales bacterium]|nr:Uma2 family endonuclease [Pirellulales bacterium]